MKVTKVEQKSTITIKTSAASVKGDRAYKWWLAKNDQELAQQLLATATYLKEGQNYRYKQASVYAKLYGNVSLFSFLGAASTSKMDITQGLPADRPTFNLVQSATGKVACVVCL